ncbi:hypothetical protein AAVH_12537 [Aphelenchoides avenae]|nr:hypothetical protein AAVH_12537 [Aphelenchus avenae]
MSFDEAYSWALFSITFTSVNIQVYVIWVILTKSPPAMHEYRYFLCVYTLCDLTFTFVFGFVVHPEPLFPSKAASVNGLAKLLGQGGAGLSMALVCALGAMVVAAQDYCLIYRMTVVLEDQRYNKFLVSKWVYGAVYAVGAALAVVVGLPFYHSTSQDPDYIIPNILKYEAARPLLKDDIVIIYLRTDVPWATLMMLTVVSGVIVAALVGFGAVSLCSYSRR